MITEVLCHFMMIQQLYFRNVYVFNKTSQIGIILGGCLSITKNLKVYPLKLTIF